MGLWLRFFLACHSGASDIISPHTSISAMSPRSSIPTMSPPRLFQMQLSLTRDVAEPSVMSGITLDLNETMLIRAI